MKRLLAAMAFSLMTLPAWAATQTVTLNVPGMTCPACPITIRTALSRAPGVSHVTVSFDKREAIVTFDDAKTNVARLIQATTDAGYPSTVEQGAK